MAPTHELGRPKRLRKVSAPTLTCRPELDVAVTWVAAPAPSRAVTATETRSGRPNSASRPGTLTVRLHAAKVGLIVRSRLHGSATPVR